MKIIYFLFFIYSSLLFAQKDSIVPFNVSNKNVAEDITDKFSYLFTDDKSITYNKILKIQGQLKKKYCGCIEKEIKNLPKDIWLISKIKNTTKDTLDLVFYTSNSQKVITYLVSKNKTIKKTVGYIQDADSLFSKEMVNAINFKLNPKEEKTIILHQEVYIKYDLIFKFNLISKDTYNTVALENYRYYQKNRFFLGILSGSHLLLFFYNFIMFYKSRARIYLNYSLYILSTFIFIILVLDRNRNTFISAIMLHFDLIKEVFYMLSILFYALFVKTVLKKITSTLNKTIKIYFSILLIYLLYLIILFYKNPFTFNESTLTLILLMKYLSLAFIVVMVRQLYIRKSEIFIKYIFLGSIILIGSCILQALLEYLDRDYLNRNFSKLIVKTNVSIVLGTLIEISFFSYALYLKSLEIVKEKIILENLNSIKSNFFANISHEFRTPLTLIKSPIQSLQNEITDENQIKKLKLIDNSSSRMLELVDQLLQLSKLDSGKLQLILKEGNISSFLNSIVESFSFQAKEYKLLFTINIEKNSQNHHFDKDIIEKIVTNLLSNAIKYTLPNEKINFESKIENNLLQLIVSNSGSKIKREELPKLFERFYQKNENKQGVGIGLALVKELVELYNGKIETFVENEILSFKISLLLEKSNTNAIVLNLDNQSKIIKNSTSLDVELPILLLVDDNADIRTILKDIFLNKFQIIEAQDGIQALKIAQKEIPDCIISDVMMPKMDGLEFTKAIKENELTSFIPVILLTAKTSDESHLEGLKSTADAYLTKPFNNDIVKETVNQLINERKKLQERYCQELVLKPTDIVINSFDEKFIEKLQQVLDKEISNPDFATDVFATSIGMSRMQLHRKLKSLFGVSATEFLRNERLKLAAQLLKQSKGNISEIAYSIGFNDVSYFSKCFKEMYNCTPTEYSEK